VAAKTRILGFASLLIALLLVPRLVQFVTFSTGLVAWPWQMDYDEGVNLHAAWLLAHGDNIYRPNPPDRFISAPYPPLMYLLTVPTLWLGGLHLLGPRLIVLAGTLAVGGLLVYLVRREGAGWPGAVLAGATWFALTPVIIWSALYKQDMIALALGLGGLAVLQAHPLQGRGRYWALALFALAFFTKQSALAPAAAGVAWLFLRDRRAGLRFGGVLLGVLVAGFVALLALSRGGFWEHAIVYQTFPWTLDYWRRLMGRLSGEYGALTLIGAVVALWGLGGWLRRLRGANLLRDNLELSLPVLYALAATGSLMIQAGYAEGNYNHLLDIFPPLIWLLGRALTGARTARTAPQWALVAGLYVLLLVQVWLPQGPERWYSMIYWPSPARTTEMTRLGALLRDTPGEIYTEDATVVLLTGRPLAYDDPDTIAAMGQRGLWDQSRVVQDLRDRRFPLIFMRHGAYRWSRAGLAAFDDSYEPAFQGSIDIYRPRVYPLGPQYTLGCEMGSPAELRLAGVSLGPGVALDGIAAGSDLRLALYWDALRPPGDYATFVHLIDATGQTVAARDNPHSAAGRPTSAWAPGTSVTEITDLPLPAGLAPGTYRLIGGVYSTAGGQFQPVPVACPAAPERRVGDAVDLGAIPVR
jgi:hypothetical protein